MKPEVNRLLSVAQEITFAKALSSNEKSLRDRALRRLKKWLIAKSDSSENFTEDGFMRLWKGLFYCVWMSDKPLVQEDLVEEVCQLIHCFSNFLDGLMFVRCFFQAMSQAWFGIDSFRLDKFMMLVRRSLRHCFEYLRRRGWKKRQVTNFSNDLSNSLKLAPTGLNLHITELYLEELAKIGRGILKEEIVFLFIKPLGELLSQTTDSRLISAITNDVFYYLIQQSDLGIKYQIKFETWKQLGFPGGHINALEEVETDNKENAEEEVNENLVEEEEPTELDPRAGRVDVLLPPLPFSAQAIVRMMKHLKTNNDTTTKARKAIASIIDRFSKLEAGEYPLGIQKVELPDSDDDEEEMVNEAAVRLLEFDEECDDGLTEDFLGKKFKRKRKKKINNDHLGESGLKRRKRNEWTVTEEGMNSVMQEGLDNTVMHGCWDVSEISSENLDKNHLNSGKRRRVGNVEDIKKNVLSNPVATNRTLKTVTGSKTNSPDSSKCVSKTSVTILPKLRQRGSGKSAKLKENSPKCPPQSLDKISGTPTSQQKNRGGGEGKIEEKISGDSNSVEVSPKTPNQSNTNKLSPGCMNQKLKNQVNGKSPGVTPVKSKGRKAGGVAPSTTQQSSQCMATNKKRKLKRNMATDNGGWGQSEWDEPLKDGEVEIFIPNKKFSKAKKLGSILKSPAPNMCVAEQTTPTNVSSPMVNTPGSTKKVAFVLNRNTAQEATEYKLALKQKPTIPYDATKKPSQGVLKPSAVISPINPFYKNIVKPFSVKL